MLSNPKETTDLVIFSKEIFNEKTFFCAGVNPRQHNSHNLLI